MKRSLIIVTTLAALSVLAAGPLLAGESRRDSDGNGAAEAQMFLAAQVSLQQASDIAMKEVTGTLSAIGFNDENGRGVYEATIVDSSGVGSIVKIDADTGTVLAKGLASLLDDEGGDDGEDGENGHNEDNDS